YSIGALAAGDHERRFQKLEQQAKRDLPRAQIQRLADMRYAGQSYELTVPWRGGDARLFHVEHKRVYGYSDPKRTTETVTLRVRATVPVKRPSLRVPRVRTRGTTEKRRVWIGRRWRLLPAAPRVNLSGSHSRGPVLVTDYGSTTLVPPGWTIRIDSAENLVLRRPLTRGGVLSGLFRRFDR